MSNWGILLIVLGIVFVISLVISIFLESWDLLEFWAGMTVFIGFVLILLSAIVLVIKTTNDIEVERFKNLEEMVQETITDTNTEYNYALNLKVLEYNSWLNSAKVKKEKFKKWSLYNDELLQLEYINIKE